MRRAELRRSSHPSVIPARDPFINQETPMPALHTLPRTLIAVLAAMALAAPVAVARPIDTPKAGHAAPSERTQDLRHLKAGQLRTSSLAGTSETQLGDVGPVYWSYDQPAPVPATAAVHVDDGTPWTTIGIAIAAACFLVAGAAAMAARTHVRSRSERVAA
jgi:hypothetical protein